MGDLYRSVRVPEKCLYPGTNLVKDRKDFLLPEFHHILNGWKNNFCHLLNVRGVNNGSQIQL
jgi:hypothetical protein